MKVSDDEVESDDQGSADDSDLEELQTSPQVGNLKDQVTRQGFSGDEDDDDDDDAEKSEEVSSEYE